uniref:Uncharacterized protein n=1 Tax=Caenorhabditis japonica TaxID=281687 RepID=A0A8R1IAJ3_CAEJA
MQDIPKRVYEVWQTPLTIKDCGDLMKKIRLECSQCDRSFDSEKGFARHIEKCLVGANHDVNFQVHMHANRLLILQHRVAMFCGTSDQETVLECGLCREEFEDEEQVRTHLRHCTNYQKEFQKFMVSCNPIFSTMLHSYEQLCHLFQNFLMDEHIIKIRETGTPPLAEGELPQLEPTDPSLCFDDLSEHFIEKYQEYIFVVTNFIDDAFNRYLMKREREEKDRKLKEIRQNLLEKIGTSEEDEYLLDSDDEDDIIDSEHSDDGEGSECAMSVVEYFSDEQDEYMYMEEEEEDDEEPEQGNYEACALHEENEHYDHFFEFSEEVKKESIKDLENPEEYYQDSLEHHTKHGFFVEDESDYEDEIIDVVM